MIFGFLLRIQNLIKPNFNWLKKRERKDQTPLKRTLRKRKRHPIITKTAKTIQKLISNSCVTSLILFVRFYGISREEKI